MIKSEFELRIFRRTNENMAIAKELAAREPSKEFHILANEHKICLITHYLWNRCKYCNLPEDDEGVVEL